MLSLIFIIVFIFCLAIAIAVIWISRQAISMYDTDFHKNYFYYLVTFYAFAFYGIWAQILMRALLSSMDTDYGLVGLAANFLPILGVPFLGVSWIMLLKMGYSLTGTPIKRNVLGFHVICIVGIVPLVLGIYMLWQQEDRFLGEQLAYAEMGLILLMELASMILFAGVVLHKSKKFKKTKRRIWVLFVALMFLGLLLRGTVLPFIFSGPWYVAPIVLLYFLSNFFPLYYLNINSDIVFVPVYAGYPNAQKRDLLCKKYGITKREREIMDCLCEGKTNQQIADELFISLQTVKDHTHRIYSKIGINSRMKLVQLIST